MTFASHALLLMTACSACLASAPAAAGPSPVSAAQPEAAPRATAFTLSNGLKVVVQPDRRVPIVTVALVYDVGSKDEKPGQFGYAHLFEHLMLQGSLHWNQDATRSYHDMGAPGANATTTEDRTIFYATVPSAALERALFLEADRMGFLAEALTPERVAREVEVVLNEKRQRGGAANGEDGATIAADLYPPDHPYHHSVIGTEQDLRAVTVDQARQWFRDFYGPANATLILTGDLSIEAARDLAQRYFGGLAPRAPVGRLLTDDAPLPGPIRRQTFAAVPTARLYATFRAPPAGSAAIADLDLIAQIMANGPASRLKKRLVDELGIVGSVMVTFDEKLLSSEMGFVLDGVRPDQTARVEAEMHTALTTFIAEGPTPAELDRAREARIRHMLQLQESTFGEAFALMRSASLGDPDYAATYLRQLRSATPERVRATAAAVYGKPGHLLIASPLPPFKPATGGYDLAKGPPAMAAVQPIAFPAIAEARLATGLRVVLVPRTGSGTANLLLRIDAGSASATWPIAEIAVALMAEDKALPARAEALGGQLRYRVAADYTDLTLSVDTPALAKGIGLLGEVLAHTDPDPAALKAQQQRRLAVLRGEEMRPWTGAQRLLRNGVYGAHHPYGASAAPGEDVRTVQALDVGTIRAWDRGHVRPDRATLYVAADTDMATLRPLLEAALGRWKADGPAAPMVAIPPAPAQSAPTLTVLDKPGAAQTFVAAARLLPPSTASGDIALDAANEVYGGNNTSRISANLRQDKGWTYGIGSGTRDARGQRLWEIAGSVAPDHSGAAIAELIAELRALSKDRPPTQAELDRIAAASVNQTAARLEDGADLLQAMADAQSYGRPYDSVVRDPARYRALTLDQVRDAAHMLADPSALHWLVVGDWQKIRGQFTGLGIGTPNVIPASGE